MDRRDHLAADPYVAHAGATVASSAVFTATTAVGGAAVLGRNPVKAIDEYNYCRYTLKRLS